LQNDRQPRAGQLGGVLLLNKPLEWPSFRLVKLIRRQLDVRKVGHAGTLDPFATGVMILLVGREYTRLSDRFLNTDKEYEGVIHLGVETDTYDCKGQILSISSLVPSVQQVEEVLQHFQGRVSQLPPMYSAKKVGGQKLYRLARRGECVERARVIIDMEVECLSYSYPELVVRVRCSKGGYIRCLAHDVGQFLGCGAHLEWLKRIRSGPFCLEDCLEVAYIERGDPAWIQRQLIGAGRLEQWLERGG